MKIILFALIISVSHIITDNNTFCANRPRPTPQRPISITKPQPNKIQPAARGVPQNAYKKVDNKHINHNGNIITRTAGIIEAPIVATANAAQYVVRGVVGTVGRVANIPNNVVRKISQNTNNNNSNNSHHKDGHQNIITNSIDNTINTNNIKVPASTEKEPDIKVTKNNNIIKNTTNLEENNTNTVTKSLNNITINHSATIEEAGNIKPLVTTTHEEHSSVELSLAKPIKPSEISETKVENNSKNIINNTNIIENTTNAKTPTNIEKEEHIQNNKPIKPSEISETEKEIKPNHNEINTNFAPTETSEQTSPKRKLFSGIMSIFGFGKQTETNATGVAINTNKINNTTNETTANITSNKTIQEQAIEGTPTKQTTNITPEENIQNTNKTNTEIATQKITTEQTPGIINTFPKIEPEVAIRNINETTQNKTIQTVNTNVTQGVEEKTSKPVNITQTVKETTPPENIQTAKQVINEVKNSTESLINKNNIPIETQNVNNTTETKNTTNTTNKQSAPDNTTNTTQSNTTKTTNDTSTAASKPTNTTTSNTTWLGRLFGWK